MSRGERGGFRGNRGGFRGGFSQQSFGPPDTVTGTELLQMGTFLHACEGEMVYTSTNSKIPYFNAPIYLENKSPIGKVDEILGPMNQVYFTVKPQDGIVAASFHAGDKVYIGPDKLLPLDRFLPKPTPPGGVKKPSRGSSRGSGRGGSSRGVRGGSSRGFGNSRGGSRGGFQGGFSRGRGTPRGRGAPRSRGRF
ncbi:H/ACA ribonucleoprotein complex subunit 1 [Neolecta irregularis DAH-3]|uniref:H/ACA ribonucleoprotein complex subunit n=1 Tax=Neolecta irregularis (strain DAH-3) TaxID=1198029 RepID=A0A1U7LH27_NEOID|nr:H/ACA ribonucleoprotein complex subunit 1 [Neolecta irregularis DAH-3]|eukprot:OLL21852.1 H/ACA ribonucleoprotein complex subunit 1 [Neolecta irregularis DAH-3]